MKNMFKFCLLLLALGGFEAAYASLPGMWHIPSVRSVSLSGTVTQSAVCANVPFTATVNVDNEVSGLTYRWGVAIGTVNGVADFVTTASKSVTCVVLRPPGGTNIARVSVVMLRNGVIVTTNGTGVRDLTVATAGVPAQPGSITFQSYSPTFGAICERTTGIISVSPVPGAYQYEWTFDGNSFVTTDSGVAVGFFNPGTITATVRARGCGGVSGASSQSYFVLAAGEGPCPSTFAQAVEVAPNPASSEFTLTTTEDNVSATAQLADSKTGTVAKRFTVTGTATKVDVRGLPAGTYVLTVNGKKGKVSSRVVVEK